MSTNKSDYLPKSEWGDGPWQTEPDAKDWQHDGFHCFIRRPWHGAWCGYVVIPSGHPWYGQDYDSIDVTCHGGLTCATKPEGQIVPEGIPAEELEGVWIVGFDCCHCDDLAPAAGSGYRKSMFSLSGYQKYRDMEYVIGQVNQLARQALEDTPTPEPEVVIP